jgi:hypothetical protein
MRLRINSVNIKKYQRAFWCRCQETVAVFSLNLVHPRICIFFFYKKTKYFHHEHNPIKNISFSKGEFREPPPKPTLHSRCELHPGLIAMVRAQPFYGLENENPCHHLLLEVLNS